MNNKTKKTAILSLVAAMTLSCGAAVATSVTPDFLWSKVVVAEEAPVNGTVENPYVITTKADFFAFAEKVNNGTLKNVYAELGADIDLEQEDWIPIGTSARPFTGTFDGKGHTIYNLWSYERGLFGFTSTGNYIDSGLNGRATIKNFTLNGAEVYNEKTSAVGSVVGQAGQNTEISNVTVCGKVQIHGYGYVGGIVGQGYVRLNDCHVNASGTEESEIAAHYWGAGGMVGHAGGEGGSAVVDCSVSNVRFYTQHYGAGAIMGVGTSGPIENVTAKNVVIEAQYSPDASGYLVGCNYKAITGNSYAEDVTLIVGDEVITAVQDAGATIGDKYYVSLQAAINLAKAGDTVTLAADLTQKEGVLVTDKNITIDLNGKTFTVSEGANTNNRNFKINGTSEVTIQNGTMVAQGDYSSGAYGTIRTEGSAVVTLTGLELYNYRGNGLNVKALSGTTVYIEDTEVYSVYGGGIESAGGTIELNNVTVEQKGMYTAPYNSMAISVNGGGTVTVNSGTYSTECITAEEANNQGTSHGPWVAGVLNSGGSLIVNGGTFSNDNFGENALATAARGAILADTGASVKINGGTFNALKAIMDVQNNLGDASRNPSVVLNGGTFSADPTVSALYASNLISLGDGYRVMQVLDTYAVVKLDEYAFDLTATKAALMANESVDVTVSIDKAYYSAEYTFKYDVSNFTCAADIDGDGKIFVTGLYEGAAGALATYTLVAKNNINSVATGDMFEVTGKVLQYKEQTLTGLENVVTGDKVNVTLSLNYTASVVKDYISGYSLVLVKGDDAGYAYNGVKMFYVEAYEAYALIVKGNVTAEAIDVALSKSSGCEVLSLSYNVNAEYVTDGVVDLKDATAVYTCLNDGYGIDEYMELYLRADVNGDGRVNVVDINEVVKNYTK